MVWDTGLRSHIIAGMVWDFNRTFHGMGYSWDVLWGGVFLGHPNGMSHWDPIGMLFFEVTLLAAAAESHLRAILEAIFGSYIAAAESHLGVIFGSRIAGCCSGVMFRSHIRILFSDN